MRKKKKYAFIDNNKKKNRTRSFFIILSVAISISFIYSFSASSSVTLPLTPENRGQIKNILIVADIKNPESNDNQVYEIAISYAGKSYSTPGCNKSYSGDELRDAKDLLVSRIKKAVDNSEVFSVKYLTEKMSESLNKDLNDKIKILTLKSNKNADIESISVELSRLEHPEKYKYKTALHVLIRHYAESSCYNMKAVPWAYIRLVDIATQKEIYSKKIDGKFVYTIGPDYDQNEFSQSKFNTEYLNNYTLFLDKINKTAIKTISKNFKEMR